MSLHQQPTPFFTLPLELREQIYKEVLTSPSKRHSLLETCREVKAEAHKFLFQRHIRFENQTHLFSWLDKAPVSLLRYVGEISLGINEADHRPLLKASTHAFSSGSQSFLIDQQDERELQRLQDGLMKLANVKTITIQALGNARNFLYRDFLAKVLELVTMLYPGLLDLRLKGDMHHQSLYYLRSLRHLRSFSFDGFALSTSTATAEILGNLEKLDSLSLVSEPVTPRRSSPRTGGSPSKSQSFNGEVMRAIQQLASFSVVECKPSPAPTLFFTSEVLASLPSHKKLHNLSVTLSHRPDCETVNALQDFVARSGISRLELDWPGLTAELFEDHALLQNKLQTLWVRTESESKALGMLEHILRLRAREQLQHLIRVVLIRSLQTDMTHGEDIRVAKRELESLGVQIAWCTETK